MLELVPGPGQRTEFLDRKVRDLPDCLRAGDVLVVNDTRVVPARLSGVRARQGVTARVEVTLHKRDDAATWRAFAKPARKLVAGDAIVFDMLGLALSAEVLARQDGEVSLRFDRAGEALDAALDRLGRPPLPPYIESRRAADAADHSDYQTLFANVPGAVAGSNGGPALHAALGAEPCRPRCPYPPGHPARRRRDLFAGQKRNDDQHVMHAEYGEVSAAVADALNQARAGGRLVAVGTTSLRILESAAEPDGTIRPFAGETSIFITPGYRFRAVDALMTNFHLPRSTLFMLVSAFAGLETMRDAYAHAMRSGYRLLFLRRRLVAMAPRGRLVTQDFRFDILARDGSARTGVIRTARGEIRTPAFMPVGTAGTVKAMYADQVRALGADIVLGNTYHLMIRPGAEAYCGTRGDCMASWGGRIRSSPIRAASRSCRWPSCASSTRPA